jgi:hypothetical protein
MEVTTGILVIFVYPKQIPVFVQNKEYGEGADINPQNMHELCTHANRLHRPQKKEFSHGSNS